MTSIPIPARVEAHPHLRALNVLRDLPAVADLIELCFAHYYDEDGEEYILQMRRAGRDESWMRWASTAIGSASMPLTGYVWTEGGRIVGNVSLIVFHHRRRKYNMLANVAVHPEFRHRGIARALAERAILHARERKAEEIWLTVRDDNPDALDLYADLGFVERARRTTWTSTHDFRAPAAAPRFQVTQRRVQHWPAQKKWLDELHPDELRWYRGWNFDSLAPGFWNWLYLIFMDANLKQWSILSDGKLQAVLSWIPNGSRREPLWLALGEDSDPEAVTRLLVQARRELGARKFILEHPSGRADESIRAAGFRAERTLVWMSAPGATK
ncbi:MAG: hypothetical protein HFACDABA_00520 [Anaerolineales bacterium]|nr:hypothetical protein [Anaerolineales bacterium]